MSEIDTERLRLRKFRPDDLARLSEIYRDPEVMRYIGQGLPYSEAQTEKSLKAMIEHWQKHGFGLWAVDYKDDGNLIGFCGLQFLDNTDEVEVGYRLARAYWGRGLASEGTRASLDYGFNTLALDRIVAVVQHKNIASQRVLEKAGLCYEKDACYYRTDVKYYALSRKAWVGG